MLRGQVAAEAGVPSNFPFGCSGNDIQKPFASEPAATLSRQVLFGLVIQKLATVLSEGSSTSLDDWPLVRGPSPVAARLVGTQALLVWHLVWIARLRTYWLLCSIPSSRKKQ